MAEQAADTLRELWQHKLVWKAISAVVIFGNLFTFLLLWRTFAPADLADAYRTTLAVAGSLAGVGELMLLDRWLAPDRAFSTSLKVILAVGAVAAFSLALWCDSLFRPASAPPPSAAAPAGPTRQMTDQFQQDLQTYEQIKQRLAAERAARGSGAATAPATAPAGR